MWQMIASLMRIAWPLQINVKIPLLIDTSYCIIPGTTPGNSKEDYSFGSLVVGFICVSDGISCRWPDSVIAAIVSSKTLRFTLQLTPALCFCGHSAKNWSQLSFVVCFFWEGGGQDRYLDPYLHSSLLWVLMDTSLQLSVALWVPCGQAAYQSHTSE